MILAPELMQFAIDDVPTMLHSLSKWAAEKQNYGTVILVPSAYAAKSWEGAAIVANHTEMVATCVKKLQEGRALGPFVFANRYDGIDLPGQACRLLIISGLPRGTSEYEQYRANTFLGGTSLNSALAQRIEQGMGRAARGAGDYCVVIVTGKDLIAWIGRSANVKFLTNSSRAQLEMGAEISKSISSKNELADTILRCLKRDKDWIEYHAETLAELVAPNQIDINELKHANVERKAFRLFRDGYFEKAITRIDKYCEQEDSLDQQSKGWLSQFAARIAYYWGRKDLSQELQQHAYARNRNLTRPQIAPPYVTLTTPGKQAEAIVDGIDSFRVRRGYIAEFDEVISHLVPESSANQFEQALADFGSMLGFRTERPEKVYGKGPDVLWLVGDDLSLVIEAKSRKNRGNALTKDQHGQLLNAAEWFKDAYPQRSCIRVSIHRNVIATKTTVTGESKALTLDKLNELIADGRQLLVTLCESVVPHDELIT